MTDKEEPLAVKNVAFTKVWQSGVLCFDFIGASYRNVNDVFRKLKSLYKGFQITAGSRRYILNGKCYRSIAVTVQLPMFGLIPESEWPMLITRLLKKAVPCEVTYFDDFSEFLNT